MPEELSGGHRSMVRKDGDAVIRSATSAYAIRLLTYLAERDWPHSPRILWHSASHTALTFLDGDAALTPDERGAVAGDTPLAALARIVRSLHDLTAGTPLAGDLEVACHNDLDPRNTIYRRMRSDPTPLALIDWDLATPGERVHDLAHACWTFTGLGPDADAGMVARRTRVLLSAYGWDGTYGEVVEAMQWWQNRCWTGILAGAEAGVEADSRLVERGVVQEVQAAELWTRKHL